MNQRQKKLAEKIGRLTQRLETGTPDTKLSAAENARAAAELRAIAARLAAIFPNPSYSPEARVERLAHAVGHVTPNFDKLEPASHVLARLKARVDELLPGTDLTTEAKIEKLAEFFHAAFPEKVRDVA